MSLISALASRGRMRFMIKESGGVNAAVFIDFLNPLLAGSKHTIFLSVDRGPAHRAKKTKAFVASRGYCSTTSGNITDDVILQYLQEHETTGVSR